MFKTRFGRTQSYRLRTDDNENYFTANNLGMKILFLINNLNSILD